MNNVDYKITMNEQNSEKKVTSEHRKGINSA